MVALYLYSFVALYLYPLRRIFVRHFPIINGQAPVIVSIQNQKGGVGKTATAVSLAAVAYASGRPCLLIDLDPQASASEHIAPDRDGRLGMGHVLLGQTDIGQARWEARPEHAMGPALHVVCGDDGLIAAEAQLRANRDVLGLRRALQPLRHSYEFIVIDVGPSITQLSVSALYAADMIICPLTLTSTSLTGVRRLFELTSRAAEQGHEPDLLILPVAADRRLRETREIYRALVQHFGKHPDGRVLEPIRYSSAFSRAFGERRTIIEYDFVHQRSNGTRDPAAKRAVEDYAQTLEALTKTGSHAQAP